MQGSLFIYTAMKKIIATLILTLFTLTLSAQGSADACRFSQTFYQGTAKSLGMGNAMGAVGGDMTAICINPGGMGLYRSDELTATINFSDNSIASNYYGNDEKDHKMRVSMPNIGYVHSRQRSNYKPIRYTQFCIGLTRTNDFNMHTFASGLNPSSSKIDDYLNQIRYNFYPEGYDGELYTSMFSTTQLEENASAYTILPAWSTYLIDLYGEEPHRYYSSPIPQGGINQSFEQEFKGRSEEWDFGYSVNIKDRFFIGATLAVTYIKRDGISEFKESMPEDTEIETSFNQWTFTENLSSRGFGFNGKIGFIWIANPWLRLGAALHSPSMYSFDESWQTETESRIEWVTSKSFSPNSSYEYIFISPLKCLGSAAFVIGQRGMVSLDMEYVNYGMARFKASDYDYSSVNEAIKADYGHTMNFRIGTEWRVNDSYLRFGLGYYGSPMGLGKQNGSVKKASVGLSLPLGSIVTFDLAYELSHGKRQYTLYDAGSLGIEPVTQSQLRNVAIATLKIRF